jgi:NAD(P)-dependent dehydrogenase (short-subunit alcohol dehydrogenase family)
MKEIDLSGQVAIVTGAGGGIGRVEALELGSRGAAVVVNDITEGAGPAGPGAVAVAEEIRSRGGRAVATKESVASQAGGQAIVDTAVSEFGGLHIIVHNAGVWRNAAYGDMTADRLDPVLDVHLRGGFFITQPAWGHLQAQRYGRIVLTSSGVGAFGRVNGANYVAAKAGLFGLCLAMALEGEEHGIRVNSIMPIAGTLKNPKERYREDRKEPERVSPLVTYLCSPACMVNGEGFSVGMGGHMARIFVGVTRGWWTGDPFPTAEGVQEHLAEIEDQSEYSVPKSNAEFMDAITERLRRERSR